MSDFAYILQELQARQGVGLLLQGLKGLEKEGLRYDFRGNLSKRSHPRIFGHPLTHSEITTDYAESLLELVTPAVQSNSDLLRYLQYLHRLLGQSRSEYILNASMPAKLPPLEEIAIGDYGESHAAKMRKLYREGLGPRYGKAMQLIAGVHYNYSVAPQLMDELAQIRGQSSDQGFRNKQYMNLLRNVHRHGWLTVFLFGHSPAVDQSFFQGQAHKLQHLENNNLFLPFACSLRMSDIGYQNKSGVPVSVNSLEEYIRDLRSAVMMPWPEYEKMGLYNQQGDYQQISTNLLQIENEYYSIVRPKQVAASGEAPLASLAKHGIAYVELRNLDINSFHPLGISPQQLDFLELFMLFCFLQEAPPISAEELAGYQQNLQQVAASGRDPQLRLNIDGHRVSIVEAAEEAFQGMKQLAHFLDSHLCDNRYCKILERMQSLVRAPELCPSALILDILSGAFGSEQSYHNFSTQLSQQHYYHQLQYPLSRDEQAKAQQELAASLHLEKKLLEDSQNLSFSEYLAAYFQQIERL